LGPTVMNLAGVDVPNHMHGQPFLGADLPRPRRHIFGARDRVDERYDMIRSVRDRRYRYVHNYEPWRPHLQWVDYAERTPTRKEMRRLLAEGTLQPEAAQFLADTKRFEELYDLDADPHEVNNLADSPEHRAVRKRLRRALTDWMVETRDVGLIPEAELVELEKQIGSRYEILRQPSAMRVHRRLREVVKAGEGGNLKRLRDALADDDASVRFWAAMWLGTIADYDALPELLTALDDESPVVRIAAARGVCLMGNASAGLPVLERELREGENEYVRLRAATELDYLGEAARPALETVRTAAKEDKSNYVKRLAERIIQELETG
ncbi:MAG TPA: HEAT repeat domain-containing protein, partial [Armatimonadota bacterium]|nr:HEAT repeat domain-containing protein [Armatimonadota bacterium]